MQKNREMRARTDENLFEPFFCFCKCGDVMNICEERKIKSCVRRLPALRMWANATIKLYVIIIIKTLRRRSQDFLLRETLLQKNFLSKTASNWYQCPNICVIFPWNSWVVFGNDVTGLLFCDSWNNKSLNFQSKLKDLYLVTPWFCDIIPEQLPSP